jgi:hypothetical protein
MGIEYRELRGVRPVEVAIAGQATAGTVDEFPLLRVPFACKLVAVYFVWKAAITANGTNYFAATIRNRGAAAAGTAVAATRSFIAGNAAAFVPEAGTLSTTAADLAFAAGDVLTCEKLVTASGLAMPAAAIILHLQGNGA